MDNEKEIEKEKVMTMKSMSKTAMLFASAWVIALTISVGLHFIDLDINDIIKTALTVVAIWTPGYISIHLDKIKQIKEVFK